MKVSVRASVRRLPRFCGDLTRALPTLRSPRGDYTRHVSWITKIKVSRASLSLKKIILLNFSVLKFSYRFVNGYLMNV